MEQIEADSAVPLYRQLADLLRAKISDGAIATGDRIPSEARLSETYRISRITVRQALAELENDNLLKRVPGKGTFVRGTEARAERLTRLSGFGENMAALGRQVGYRTVRAGESSVPVQVAERLQAPDGRAYVIERGLLADGRPMGMHVSYLPLWLVAMDRSRLLFTRESLDRRSLYGAIEECGIQLYRAEETVKPAVADREEARMLEITEGDLLLQVKRTVYDPDERPVEYVVLTYRSDSFTFRLHLYRNPGA